MNVYCSNNHRKKEKSLLEKTTSQELSFLPNHQTHEKQETVAAEIQASVSSVGLEYAQSLGFWKAGLYEISLMILILQMKR